MAYSEADVQQRIKLVQDHLAARLRNHLDTAATANDDTFSIVEDLLRSDSTPQFTFYGRRAHGPDVPMSLDSYLNELRATRKEFPTSRFVLVDISTSVDLKIGVASQMVNYEVLGQPEGVVKKAVGIWRWVLWDKKWRVDSVKCMPGLGTFVD